jgi:predicted DsbA family dithiol-disulfide isomerase
MELLEVYADVACPFAHAGLRRLVAERAARGVSEPLLRVRAWPLERVNDEPHQGSSTAPKVAALRAGVAPGLFAGFEPAAFPASSLAALAAEAAAYRAGPEIGERFSLAIRSALFDEGADVADPAVLERVGAEVGAPGTTPDDVSQVHADHAAGKARGVDGSPHFFTASGADFFCPSMDIQRQGGAIQVTFDVVGFDRFTAAVFGPDA